MFFPLYVTPKLRRTISSFDISPQIDKDLDTTSFFQVCQIPPDDLISESELKFQVASQIYSRLAVDETVSAIVGVPMSKLSESDFDDFEARMMSTKEYWVVGIQFMGKENAKKWLQGKTHNYIHMNGVPENSDRASNSSSKDKNEPFITFQLYYRKQARVLFANHGIKAFLASLFWGNPPTSADFDGPNNGGGLIGAAIQDKGASTKPLIEIAGEGGGSDGSDDGDVVVVEQDGDATSDATNFDKNSQKNNRKLKKDNNEIQVVMKGKIQVKGPGAGNGIRHATKDTENTLQHSSSESNESKPCNSSDNNQPSLALPKTMARLEFIATKQLNPEEVGVQFQNTVLIYTDSATGKLVRQRLR